MMRTKLALLTLFASFGSAHAAYVPEDPWNDGRTGIGASPEGIVGPAHTPEAALSHIVDQERSDMSEVMSSYVAVRDWSALPPLNYIPPPYHRDALEGVRICIDPGHAGDYTPGERFPEAAMTLETALMLREFLEGSGAEVVMTRETGEDSPDRGNLEWRARLADRENCDLFISIHQNSSSRRTANYVSVWYHSRPDQPRSAVDLARWVVLDLHRNLRHDEPQHAGLYSSWLMYAPNAEEKNPELYEMDNLDRLPSGFGVLRHARVPAILIEGAFYSHPVGRERLSDREYLRRMAWSIYSGILNYIWTGIPSIALHERQPSVVHSERPSLRLTLDDGMHEGWGKNAPPRIHVDTLHVFIDDERALVRYRPERAELVVTPAYDLEPGEHRIRLRVLNVWGNWSWPTEIPFMIE